MDVHVENTCPRSVLDSDPKLLPEMYAQIFSKIPTELGFNAPTYLRQQPL